MADQNPTTKRHWRYQPVYQDDPAGRAVTLCECYFDDEGRLSAWTADQAIHPMGEDVKGLQSDLARMLADAYKWEPVPFDDLHIGMTFDRTGADVEQMLSALDSARSAVQ